MICDTHKTIFVENPKACSVSTKDSMVPYHIGDSNCRMIGHWTPWQISTRHPKEWAEYFKFVVVRNPIDHKASYYYYRRLHKNPKVRIPYFAQNSLEQWANDGFPFLNKKPHPDLQGFNLSSLPNKGHLDQLQFIWGVDKIIRFENYSEEIAKIHAERGFTGQLGNKSNYIERTREYSDEFKNIVKARYREEFFILGYPIS